MHRKHTYYIYNKDIHEIAKKMNPDVQPLLRLDVAITEFDLLPVVACSSNKVFLLEGKPHLDEVTTFVGLNSTPPFYYPL